MKIGVIKEIKDNEKRAALTPGIISKIKKLGFDVLVERDLGLQASIYNKQYAESGAHVCSKEEIYKCDLLLKINKPTHDEVNKLSNNQTLISFFTPALNP